MIKRNKVKLIISSLVILIPMLFGAFAGKILPAEIAVHWGFDGKADGFMNAKAVFFILPGILLALHWGCMFLEAAVNKNVEQNKKVTEIAYWIVPAISLLSCGVITLTAFGYTANIFAFVFIFLAALFIVIGNYMPKATRNITTGIKVRWTLASDENWNATHRFAGKVYVIIGVLCLLAIPLPHKVFPFVALALILCCAVLPLLYSYLFYRKQVAEGKITKEDLEKSYRAFVKNPKAARIFSVCLTVVLIITFPIIMFTGNVKTELADDSFTVKASFWSDLTLDYADVDAIEYRTEGVGGERIGGYGSARLLLGGFKNDEFGVYTRYTYTGKKPCIVLKTDGRVVVIGLENEQETKEMYEKILDKISK